MKEHFSPKQLECLSKMFSYFDYSNDETLTREELESIPDLNVDIFFSDCDTDKSKSISVQEFLQWIVSVKKAQPPDVFKLLLESLLKACKAGRKKRKENDYDAMVKNIGKLAANFRKIKAENERLKRGQKSSRQ